MRLFALRHGKTTWNEQGRIMGGGTQGDLTKQGIEDAKKVAKDIVNLSPSIIYCSDLKRAVQTIEPALRAGDMLKCVYTKDLRERDFGDLEGKLMAEVDWDGYWKTQEDQAAYNSETLKQFTQRISGFCASLDKSLDKVLVVTHIGVMNRLKYLEDPSRFEFTTFPNTKIIEFDFDKIINTAKKM